MPSYVEDWDPSIAHPCDSFDAPWNGWATPVVTLAQLRHLANRWDAVAASGDSDIARITFDGDRPTFHASPSSDPESFPMVSDSTGRFHLGDLGFTFTYETLPDAVEMADAIRAALALAYAGESIAAAELLADRFPTLAID